MQVLSGLLLCAGCAAGAGCAWALSYPVTPGRLLVGTSGFSYPDWTPRFYPAGTRPADRLAVYAGRLPAVELNNTFRRRPTPSATLRSAARTFSRCTCAGIRSSGCGCTGGGALRM